jgi:hypothetical protein
MERSTRATIHSVNSLTSNGLYNQLIRSKQKIKNLMRELRRKKNKQIINVTT